MKDELIKLIKEFSSESHGSSDYAQDDFFVKIGEEIAFAPLSFLQEKIGEKLDVRELIRMGYVCDAYEILQYRPFEEWYEKQFECKFTQKKSKSVFVLHPPNNKTIFDAIETVNSCYELLEKEKIIMNSKNLPIQLGEWYAKSIFGLKQIKSSSQRGFDFFMHGKRVEVTVDWGDASSPKGTKVKKSLMELSDYCVMIYVAKNFMIREICVLDSEYVLRRFAKKGHTIFLKDCDIAPYFFSNSDRHCDKVLNSSALLRYSSPQLAMNIAEYFSTDRT